MTEAATEQASVALPEKPHVLGAYAAPLVWQYRPTEQPFFVNSVAISARGDRVVAGTFFHDYSASGGSDQTGLFGTYLLNGQGDLLWKDEFDGFEGVYWVAISPAADFAASCGWYSNAPYTGFVFIYDAATGYRQVDFTGTTSRVSICTFAADGSAMVAGGAAVFCFLRGPGGFRSTPLTVPLPAAGDAVQGLAVDGHGHLVAVGTVQGHILLIDLQQGGAVVAQFDCGASVHSIAMDLAGSRFVAGASGGCVYYFDVAAFKVSQTPTWTEILPKASAVYGVAMNCDGTLASAVGNVDTTSGVVGLLAIGPGSGTWNWTAATLHNPNSTSMTADGGLVTVADGHPDSAPGGRLGGFYLFDARDGTLLWHKNADEMCWPMRAAASGSAAVGGSDNGKVYFFEPLRVCTG